MKHRKLLCLVVVGAACLCDATAQTNAGRTYLVGDYSGKKVCLYADGKGIVWSRSVPGVYDTWMRENGNIVFAGYGGAAEIEPDLKQGKDGKVLWEYKQDPGREVHGCQVLPDGKVLLSEAGSCRLLELDSQGEVQKEIPLKCDTKSVHLQMRMARRAGSGEYLVAFLAEGRVAIVNDAGVVSQSIETRRGGKHAHAAYEGLMLANGRVLISTAGIGTVIEVDVKTGEVAWQLTGADVPEMGMGWVAGIVRLGNGNTIVCNWTGANGAAAKAFEVTPEKKVVWKLDGKHFSGITRIQVLGANFRP